MKSFILSVFLAVAFIAGSAGASHALVWSDLGVGRSPSWMGRPVENLSASASLPWENHRWYEFEFVVSGSTVRWSIDDLVGGRYTIDSATSQSLDMSTLALRVAARPGFGDRVSLDGLSLNGSTLGDGPLSWTPLAGDAADRWWVASDLSRDCVLSGNVRWDWASAGAAPSAPELAIGVTMTDAGVMTPPVPEPGTLALFGSGILGLGAVVRRKVRR